MKAYDFACNKCGKKFEDLVNDLSEARCPDCSSADVEKLLSAFAIGGSSSSSSSFDLGSMGSGGGGGGCCGGGACGLN